MWNRQNIITLDLAGKRNKITCKCCGASETVPSKDEFITVKRPSIRTKGKTEQTLKTHYAFVQWFQDYHVSLHSEGGANE